MIALSHYRAVDSETALFSPGHMAPRVVCVSTAKIVPDGNGGSIQGSLVHRENALEKVRQYLEAGYILTFANAAYDLAVFAQADSTLLPLIFRALHEGRIHCVLIAQALDAIFHGHLGMQLDGSELRSPSTGKVSKRYSLEIVTHLLTGRVDAKEKDAWRKSYALLESTDGARWPDDAKVYPVHDATNTLEDATIQVLGKPGDHVWVEVPPLPGASSSVPKTFCKNCNEELIYSHTEPLFSHTESCPNTPRVPHKNLENLPAQVEASFALHLGACWGLRTDAERVEKLAAEVEAKHQTAVVRYQAKGWIRENGTEDQAAVKRVIALAYGAHGACARCSGTGKVRNPVEIDCRGVKLRGRYQGCVGASCEVCCGAGKYEKKGNEVTCKHLFDGVGALIEEGCDGTGLDLSTAKITRTDKLGIKTDRDIKMESGDDDLSDFGEDTYEKLRSTYVPWLREGACRPLELRPNVLVYTGRTSYDGPIQQMPRKGGARECIVARDGMYLCSTDYAAGELCTLSVYTNWIVGESQMLNVINQTKDPGSLHTMLGSQMLGVSFDEMRKRVKAGDQQAKDFRQASKCANFGFPGGLGATTLVLTNRRQAAGETKLPDGTVVAGIRFCVLLGGAERCGVEKIISWKGRECPPVCKACVNLAESILKKTFFSTFPEVRKYLNWVAAFVEKHGNIPQLAWNKEKGELEVLRTRGQVVFCDAANQGFQGLLSDIGKRALCTMTREMYLGVKDDGIPSPLGGSRVPLWLHDEPLAEVPIETAHLAGPRIAEIMMQAGYDLAPDVYWKAEPALMKWWDKNAEPVYDENKKLIPWKPKNGR